MYDIMVSYELDRAVASIRKALKDGWLLHGPLQVVSHKNDIYYVQAIILPTNHPDYR